MCILTPMEAASLRELRGTFADLVNADPDLMRAEFDAIIEASWGSQSPPRKPDEACPSDPHTPHRRAEACEVAISGGEPDLYRQSADDWTRPRSPPVKQPAAM
jgi:hypothetical protein